MSNFLIWYQKWNCNRNSFPSFPLLVCYSFKSHVLLCNLRCVNSLLWLAIIRNFTLMWINQFFWKRVGLGLWRFMTSLFPLLKFLVLWVMIRKWKGWSFFFFKWFSLRVSVFMFSPYEHAVGIRYFNLGI